MKFIVFCFTLFIFSTISAQKSCNCCTEQHAAFDFWIGTWEVTNPDGSRAGKNVIEKILDNCALRENWTSATASYTGTSTNFYNYKTKQWEQLWIDNQGESLKLKGNRTGSQMILQTDEARNKKGEPFIHRITWTLNADGSIRQLWETITNRKDITIVFDGWYKKI